MVITVGFPTLQTLHAHAFGFTNSPFVCVAQKKATVVRSLKNSKWVKLQKKLAHLRLSLLAIERETIANLSPNKMEGRTHEVGGLNPTRGQDLARHRLEVRIFPTTKPTQ